MPPSVQPVIVPLGLITQPNKLGQYPAGALLRADGLAYRSPGLMTRMPGFIDWTQIAWIATNTTPHLLGAADSFMFDIGQHVSNGHWELNFYSQPANRFGNDLFAAGLAFQPINFDSTGKINWTQQRGRYLFNSNQGIIVCDNPAPASNAQALPRHAGLQAPAVSMSPVTTGNPGALDINHVAAVVAIVRRTTSDGYELVSPPSAPGNAGHATLASDILAGAAFQATAGYAVGDVIEFYRTPQQPVDTAVGSTYYLCGKYTLIGADLAAFRIVTPPTLKAKDSGLGAELYTNPGQTGFNSFKQPPPLAACMATFKGYTFYGNRTDIATLPLQVPSGITLQLPTSDLVTRSTAIGTRAFTATFTNTSNVLTVISATDIVGLAVGQIITDASLTAGQGTITAVGATTVTLSTTANATITKLTSSADVLLINGTVVPAQYWDSMCLFMTGTPLGVLAAGIDVPVTLTGLAQQDIYSPRAFVLTAQRAGIASFTIAASNPQNYIPVLPATTASPLTVSRTNAANGLAWSEQGQPEAVPPLNTLPCGSGTIYGMWPTRDALWIFASDGLWRLTGTGGSAGRGFDWTLTQVDSTLSLAGPHGACVLRDTVYAYTNRGLVEVSPKGIRDDLSQGRLNDLLPGPPFTANRDVQIAADETNDEIWLAAAATSDLTIYVYNTLSDAWTTVQGNGLPFVHTYARFAQSIALVNSSNAYAQTSSLSFTQVFPPMTLDYQPVSDQSPLEMRRWIDETWIFDTATATFTNGGGHIPVQPRWNQVAYVAQQATPTSQLADSRLSFSVPRNAPAVANSLIPGIQIAAANFPATFYGLSLRSAPLTSQRKQR